VYVCAPTQSRSHHILFHSVLYCGLQYQTPITMPLSFLPFIQSIHSFVSSIQFVLLIRHHKLNLSKLNRSPLLCLLTTPSLKYLSSPPAVRPPTYHFSCPKTSLKPSELLSLPLLPRLEPRYLPSPGLVPGLGFLRGECIEVRAVVVAPVCCFADVVIVRGCDGDV